MPRRRHPSSLGHSPQNLSRFPPTSPRVMEPSVNPVVSVGAYKKRILLTGGCGFIGSHVTIALVERYPEYYVVVLDKMDYCASIKNLKQIKERPNFKFVQGDLCEADFMRYVFQEEKIDTVMHFAAQSHVDLSFWCSLDFTWNNVYGTHVLINTAFEAGVTRFIHVSTDEVYGGNSPKVLNEESRLAPTNPYSASKAAAECIVNAYWESFKFPIIVTRANNVYGTNQYPEKVIPKFISLLARDRKCLIHGDGRTVRNFLHARDIVNAFDIILHKGVPGETYNIGTDSQISMLQLAKDLIKKIKKVECEEEILKFIEFVEDRPFNDPRYYMESKKLAQLGWSPKVAWEDGLTETVDWYMDFENMKNWPTAEEALSAFPKGSNTKSFHQGTNRRNTTFTG